MQQQYVKCSAKGEGGLANDGDQFLKKEPVSHRPLKPNEIIVSRHKHFSIYMKRIHKLFFTQEKVQGQLVNTFDTVYIQGMGACVQRASDLALETQETYADIKIEDV